MGASAVEVSGRHERLQRIDERTHGAGVDDPYRVAPALSADCREGVGTNPKSRLRPPTPTPREKFVDSEKSDVIWGLWASRGHANEPRQPLYRRAN